MNHFVSRGEDPAECEGPQGDHTKSPTLTENVSIDLLILCDTSRVLAQWTEQTAISLWLCTLLNNSLQITLKSHLSFSKAAAHLEKLSLYCCTSSISLRIMKRILPPLQNSASISAE